MEKYCENRSCMKPALQVCGRCSVSAYCSKQCQVLAFPTHSKQCFELPPLIAISESLMSSHSDEAPFDMSLAASVVDKLTESVVGTSKAAIPSEQHTPAKVTPAFDQGPRSAPPVTYQEPKKTIPTQSKEFVVDEMKKIAPVEEPKKSVPTLPLSLNRLRMNHQKLITPPEPVKVDLRVMLTDLKIRPLPKGSFQAAALTGDPVTQVFYITESKPEVVEYMQMIEGSVAKFVESLKVTSYKPSKNEIVLALFEERYYRAVCRSSSLVEGKRHYSVQFIDYGDVAQVTEESIRPFDKSLMFEVLTHSCKLLNMPSNEEELVKLMQGGFLQLKDAEPSEDGDASYTANFDI